MPLCVLLALVFLQWCADGRLVSVEWHDAHRRVGLAEAQNAVPPRSHHAAGGVLAHAAADSGP